MNSNFRVGKTKSGNSKTNNVSSLMKQVNKLKQQKEEKMIVSRTSLIENYKKVDNEEVLFFYVDVYDAQIQAEEDEDGNETIKRVVYRKTNNRRTYFFPHGNLTLFKFLRNNFRLPKPISMDSKIAGCGIGFSNVIKGNRMAEFISSLFRFEKILNDNIFASSGMVKTFKLRLGSIDTELFIGYLGSQQQWDDRKCKPDRVKTTHRGVRVQEDKFKVMMTNVLYYKKSNDTNDGFPQLITNEWGQAVNEEGNDDIGYTFNVVDIDSIEFHINSLYEDVEASIVLKNYVTSINYNEQTKGYDIKEINLR